MIAIIDYGVGNLFSLRSSLACLGLESKITGAPEEIRQAGADVVFVYLGAPKQEKWIAKNGAATGASLLIGLGGSLDVFAGRVERAPEIWQKLSMEWLYRGLKEPVRLKRIAKLPFFLVDAVGARIKGK